MLKSKNSINPKAKNLNREYRKVISKLRKLKCPSLLVMIVGESGAGKSTFCKLMNCEDNWYVSSQPLEEMLRKENKPINHDTIHKLANHLYSQNPTWQVDKILNAMAGKKFLLLDGPRRIKEVEALLEKHPASLIIRIRTNDSYRCERLKIRDNINKDGFKRIIRDESEQMELNEILKKASITITNNGDLNELKKQAQTLKDFISNFEKYL